MSGSRWTTPELYRIATMGEARPGSDIDETLNNAAFRHLQRSVETLMAEGIFATGDSTAVALATVGRRARGGRDVDLQAVSALGRCRGIRRSGA